MKSRLTFGHKGPQILVCVPCDHISNWVYCVLYYWTRAAFQDVMMKGDLQFFHLSRLEPNPRNYHANQCLILIFCAASNLFFTLQWLCVGLRVFQVNWAWTHPAFTESESAALLLCTSHASQLSDSHITSWDRQNTWKMISLRTAWQQANLRKIECVRIRWSTGLHPWASDLCHIPLVFCYCHTLDAGELESCV